MVERLERTPRQSWIQTTFYKRECVKFLPASRDQHRCNPVCQVCQSLIRCCCGRLIGEHTYLESGSSSPLRDVPALWRHSGEEWNMELHTRASPTDAFGSIDFQDSTKRSCRAKYVRLSCDTRPELLMHLMLREWQMEVPKLVISVHGGVDNFSLPPRVSQALSKGLITAAESTGAWIFTDGINTGISRYIGEAVREYGTHDFRKRNAVGITPWGIIENHSDLIGRDVLRPYQMVGNPLSKRECLNSLHSYFLLVDDGTMGKQGGQMELRRKLERHISLQRIHSRLGQGVPVVCVVVEGGPAILTLVMDYLSSSPATPVIVFEGTGKAADLLAFIYKQTTEDRQLEPDIKQDFLERIQSMFNGVDSAEASRLFNLLMDCMKYRDYISIFDMDSQDHQEADVAILTASLKGTKATPADQLSVALAWDRADIAKEHILINRQHWKVGSLEQTMLDALIMDRVSFVQLLVENGMTMKRFLNVSRLEELYNTQHGPTDNFLHHILADAKQTHLAARYRISLIDVGLVIEYLIGGAYRSTYTRKNFRALYNRLHGAFKEGSRENTGRFSRLSIPENSPPRSYFFRTAQPYRSKEKTVTSPDVRMTPSTELNDSSFFVYTFNDLFVWAVLKRRQKMALLLWQHGEEALARAVVACKLYRAMATEAKDSNMTDGIADELKTYSLEFGQLAVDLLDKAFRENECMAMKLLTSEMKDWSHFTCLQMAVSSGLRSFVAHNCTQMMLTDLWMGRLNMRKNSWIKVIIVSILMPIAIQFLEFKSQAEMSHVPQSQEALHFGRNPNNPGALEAGQRNLSDPERGAVFFQHKSDLIAYWLSWTKKLYGFYSAPVVKFWFHSMSYLGFLMLFSYTVLVKMEDSPTPQEWLVIACILTTAVEKAREVWVSEPRKFSKKLKVWFSEYWNFSDFIAILLFLVGFILRWQSPALRTAGRLIYCLDIIFWFVRILDLLAVNQQIGPYLTMITKMTSNMFYIVVMMAIVLLSFGVSRQSILSPNEEPSWSLARDVVFQPYWMIFGEVYAGEIDACADDQPCPPGSFLTPFLQAVYLFCQYIIMVNLLIAFFNNVYFDMKSISNKLWKYNRYRYIMTYQEKPWLPPPFILLSHLTLCVNTICRKHRGTPEHERDSGLKLFLAPEDLKKLHEFEEKCVAGYFQEKNESQLNTQINQIRSTAQRAEEMTDVVAEVMEKVHFIQDSLQTLDSQLGQLQDLSALAVDTLTLFAASDNRQQEAALLGRSQPITGFHSQLSHSLSLSVGRVAGVGDAFLPPKAYQSTPPSLLCGHAQWRQQRSLELPQGESSGVCDGGTRWIVGNPDDHDKTVRWMLHRRTSSEVDIADKRITHGSLPHLRAARWCEETPCESYSPSPLGSPLMPWGSDVSELYQSKQSLPDAHLHTSCEDSLENEEEEDEEDMLSASRTSSHLFLLREIQNEKERMMGCVNPAFSRDDDSQLAKPEHPHVDRKLAHFCRKSKLRHCRSLSASVETMAMPGTTPYSSLPSPDSSKPNQVSPDSSSPPVRTQEERECQSPDNATLGRKRRFYNKRIVKIQEGDANNYREADRCNPVSETCKRRKRKVQDVDDQKFRTSISLTQLNFDQADLMRKIAFPFQNTRSPSQSVWSSWAKSISRRSSVQSGIASEVRGSAFQSTEDLHPHYSAMERNNLMRLAHTIPFTPVSLLGGEVVTIYTLEETQVGGPRNWATSESSWSQHTRTAVLQPLSRDGILDGGLRRARRVVCAWAEGDILKPGSVYIIKSFRPEVVQAWQRVFPSSTSLQLCLREIQQQRAAQKLAHIFNQIKPSNVPHSPRFLDVSLLHSTDQWLTIERNMTGDFRKYNNNTGEEILPSCGLEETMLAFSHWTYEYTCHEILVLDLQGVGTDLTDPSVIGVNDESVSPDEVVFGPANLGDDAIQSFVLKHTCNSCCEKLGLSGR
ncbi:transient receptor potential cation channel subfamily M member 6 [Chanos chanos]|uniref:non-specific serine/threonine protein kinase n=1 Tax=Chanos chanos TaxID=29144 RepID=A0A6J2WTU4_CHACN|nr:transient receptor potential cation channel subfamily M member 6 [Chanos chanos]